jgi:Alcohol dehydrogenase GroES-like domain
MMLALLSGKLRTSALQFALSRSAVDNGIFSCMMATRASGVQAGEGPAMVDNLAAILYGIDDLRVENFPISAKIPDGHVRIAIKAVGICGSDVHYWKKVTRMLV